MAVICWAVEESIQPF